MGNRYPNPDCEAANCLGDDFFFIWEYYEPGWCATMLSMCEEWGYCPPYKTHAVYGCDPPLALCVISNIDCQEIGEPPNWTGIFIVTYMYMGQVEFGYQAEGFMNRLAIDALGIGLAGTWPPYPVNNPLTSKWEPGRDPQPDSDSILLAHGYDKSNILIKFDPTIIPKPPY